MLFSLWNMFCTFTLALSTVHAQCQYGYFLYFLNFMLSQYVAQVLSEWSEMVPVTPIITGITFAFTFHMRWIYIITTLYFKIFSSYFLITFLSPGIATSINMHVPCLLSQIVMSTLYLGIVVSVCTCWFHNMVTLPSWCASTDFGTWSYKCLLSTFTYYYYYYCCCCCYGQT